MTLETPDSAQPTRPVLIVIVNYRTAHLTINCLQSLVHEVKTLPGTQVVVVDNASGDQSVAQIQTAIALHDWQEWVSVLPSEHNGGYAYGNNLAIRPALDAAMPPAYLWLLNPDTQVRPGSLTALVNFMDQHPTAGIAGSSFEKKDGTPWATAFKFPTLVSELDDGLRLGVVSKLLSQWAVSQPMPDYPQEIDWFPGASMMIRREVFNDIGLMDEGYFLYYEETDFCLQAKRAGWQCWYVPQSRVMHIAGQSTGVTAEDRAPKRLPQYLFDSRRRYFVKNHGWLYAALTDLVWAIGYALWSVRRVIQRKPNPDPPYFFLDSLRNTVIVKTVERLMWSQEAGVRS